MAEERKVLLVFENCDTMEIGMGSIRYIEISDISKSYGTLGKTFKSTLHCKYFCVEFLPHFTKKNELKNRLDITMVSLYNGEDLVDDIYLPWDTSDQYRNSYQKNFFRDGHLQIEVLKKWQKKQSLMIQTKRGG